MEQGEQNQRDDGQIFTIPPNMESFQGGTSIIDALISVVRFISPMDKRSRPPHHRETITQQSEHGEAHAPLEIDARELLGSRQEATIIHLGERYRLRITANNKLILTK